MANHSNYTKGQMEIEFFWPLTEQIELPFDYTGCAKPQTFATTTNSQMVALAQTGTTWVMAQFNGPVETPELVMALDKKPNFVVKWLYKLLNIKWKTK